VNVGKISTSVLSSFLIIMFMTVMGCGHKDAASVISGDVTGDVTANVTINLTGDITSSTTTEAGGNFSFGSVENGYYTITPYRDGYTFSPVPDPANKALTVSGASMDVTVSGASVTGANFISTFIGYSVSGNVTGAVTANVTIAGSGSSISGNVTTASDGSYSFSRVQINGDYTVTPSLPGYKFTPYYRKVPVNSASITGVDFVSARAHANGTVKGTYTWDSTTDVLIINWAEGTFPCYWPNTGTQTLTGLTITSTAMTWPGWLTWSRTSATADDPSGTWTATDESGNTYNATITASSTTGGNISVTGSMVSCAHATAHHLAGSYAILTTYYDPGHVATSVSLKGMGISSSLPLTYDTTYKVWGYGSGINLGSSAATPYTCTFTVTDSGTTWVETTKTSCFVENFATNLSPSGPISDPNMTFSWTGVSDEGAAYALEILDSIHNVIARTKNYRSTPITFDGSTILVSGQTYSYYIVVVGTSACSSGRSYAAGSFTYSP
jgi:hypothetical protein